MVREAAEVVNELAGEGLLDLQEVFWFSVNWSFGSSAVVDSGGFQATSLARAIWRRCRASSSFRSRSAWI